MSNNNQSKTNQPRSGQHTPGPWVVGGKNEGSTHQHVETQDGITIAYVSGKIVGGQDNARLIAAAPELLGALQDIINQYGDEPTSYPCSFQSFIRMAQQAVAKAEG